MLMNFNPRSLAGATVLCPRAAIAWADFNPRSLTGATLAMQDDLVNMQFQSTLPHGSDKGRIHQFALTVIFQSTLPHGSDWLFWP